MRHTLEVFSHGRLVFSSDKKWLYPLFDLERFLATSAGGFPDLAVHDKIVGRAAAMFLARLGVKSVEAGILSRPGVEVLERLGIPYSCESLVDRIACQTEEILLNEWDMEKAYSFLLARAGLQQPKAT